MPQTQIIVDKIIFLGIIALIGYLAFVTKYVSSDARNGLSKYLVRLSVPCLVITSFAGLDMSAAKLKNGVVILILSYIILMSLMAVGCGVAKLLGLKGITKSAHIFLTTCGNVTFLGYPVITAVFGTEGLYFAMLYALANDSITWTLAVLSILKNHGKSKNVLQALLNPSTISLVAGFIIFIIGFKFPTFIGEPLKAIGDTTTVVSMIFIGATIASIKLKEFANMWRGLFVVLSKMLIVPIVLIYAFSFINLTGVFPVQGLLVVIMMVALPTTSIYVALCKEYGGDEIYASQAVLITTLCSVVTLPLIYSLIGLLGNLKL